jgi:hypothetical protein
MKVRFGVSVISGTAFPHRRDLDKFAELVRIIDGSGVELIGTNDTSFIGGDAYVRATLIAQTAASAQVGIHPSNPLTREPQIMAAFLGSIDAMTEGRAFLDIGRAASPAGRVVLRVFARTSRAGGASAAVDRPVCRTRRIRRELAPFYSEVGRPSIDPELMIRMLIVGYCFGRRSADRRCRQAGHATVWRRTAAESRVRNRLPAGGNGIRTDGPSRETSRSLRPNGKSRRGKKGNLERRHLAGPRVRIPLPPAVSQQRTVPAVGKHPQQRRYGARLAWYEWTPGGKPSAASASFSKFR